MKSSRGAIHLSSRDLEYAKNIIGHIEGAVDAAGKRAIRRALRSGITAASKSAPKEFAVKPKAIRDSFKVSNPKSSSGSISGKIVSRGSPLPLIAFDVSPKTVNPRRKQKISIAVRRGSRSIFDYVFIARVGGRVGVWQRLNTYASSDNHFYTDKKGRRKESIRQQYGVSIPQMLDNDNIVSEITQSANETLTKRFDHEVQRIFSRNVK